VASVEEHYAGLLAPVYAWMGGGVAASLASGATELAELGVTGRLAVDLGAGFGTHTIPLARAGWNVLAVDSSRVLLDDLVALGEGLPIEAHCGNLLQFADHLARGATPDLVLCMGDTLTHLQSREEVCVLAREVAASLAPRGTFIATFRDYTSLQRGPARFIPVRADERRILTCFLEEAGTHVLVHDLLHENRNGHWGMRVSAYRKLRLAPAEVGRLFEDAGLAPRLSAGPRGMVRLTATR
jgi:2-polyprenyl-3-methyl-5-hydroxy-6-metoxy-1,4-benzoquinol methylase